jgi:spore maturation protein CgeB
MGHTITFAEPDAYGRQQHRDSEDFSYVTSVVYRPGTDLDAMLARAQHADVVVKHSGIGVDDVELERRIPECQPQCAVAFWDVDAPATLARMKADPSDPFRFAIPKFDVILTYGGGPAVRDGYNGYGARAYASVYNGLDPETHHPVQATHAFADLAFLGNRLPDRETRVEELFLKAAELAPEMQFLLGGEGWGDKPMPPNVRWIGHVPTANHNGLNCSVKMVLNINRASMASSGFSPPTRIFEAAGSGSCLLCDDWPGIADCFEPGREILVVRSAEDVISALRTHDRAAAGSIGAAFRARALRDHTYAQRAVLLDRALCSAVQARRSLLQEEMA